MGKQSSGSLSLELLENNSNKLSNYGNKCPNSRYFCEGVVLEENGDERYFRSFAGCKQWSCPVCSRKMVQGLRRGLKRGLKAYFERYGDGYSPKYFIKMVSLTVPGRNWREKVSTWAAEKIVKRSLVKLVAALRRKYGNALEYVWVDERQRDGYPHIHLCITGSAVVPADIYQYIDGLWHGRYGLGFTFVSTDKYDRGIDGIVKYLTKYLSKELATGVKGNRVYSMSKFLRGLCRKKKAMVTILRHGFVEWGDDGSYTLREVWQAPQYEGEWREERVLEELITFFEEKKNERYIGIQQYLF